MLHRIACTLTAAVLVLPLALPAARAQEVGGEQQVYPLAPTHPTSSQQCQNYRDQIDAIKDRYDTLHERCLADHKQDKEDYSTALSRPTCSHAACQHLHDVLYGPQYHHAKQGAEDCDAAAQRYEQEQAAEKERLQKQQEARKLALERLQQQQQQNQINADNRVINANNNATQQVNAQTAGIRNNTAQIQDATAQNQQAAAELQRKGEEAKAEGMQVDDQQYQQLAMLNHQADSQSSLFSNQDSNNLPDAQDQSISGYLSDIQQKTVEYIETQFVASAHQGLPDYDPTAKQGSQSQQDLREFEVWDEGGNQNGSKPSASSIWKQLHGDDPEPLHGDDIRMAGDVASKVPLRFPQLFPNALQAKQISKNLKQIAYYPAQKLDELVKAFDNYFNDLWSTSGSGTTTGQQDAEAHTQPKTTLTNSSYDKFKTFMFGNAGIAR
jgi:hypothetical protein